MCCVSSVPRRCPLREAPSRHRPQIRHLLKRSHRTGMLFRAGKSKTSMTLEQAVGQQFLLTFEGRETRPKQFLDVLRRHHIGGVVLFRHKNMGTLSELRGLTMALQNAAAETGQPPLLIAADQEGGQLIAVDQTTPFPGNMALGATKSENVANKVGRALGKELSA